MAIWGDRRKVSVFTDLAAPSQLHTVDNKAPESSGEPFADLPSDASKALDDFGALLCPAGWWR